MATKANPKSADLTAALKQLYMSPSTFRSEFKKDPAAAIRTLTANPAAFGKVRAYVGSISAKANLDRVRRLAQKISALKKSSLQR